MYVCAYGLFTLRTAGPFLGHNLGTRGSNMIFGGLDSWDLKDFSHTGYSNPG